MPSSAFANQGRQQNWDVQEGSAQELASDLENSEGTSAGIPLPFPRRRRTNKNYLRNP